MKTKILIQRKLDTNLTYSNRLGKFSSNSLANCLIFQPPNCPLTGLNPPNLITTSFFTSLLFICIVSTCFGFEKRTHLQFLPNVPVFLTSEVAVDVSQSHPALSLSTKGNQTIRAILSINTDQQDFPVTHPPFDLSFILKGIKIALRANDEELSFDSEKMESNVYLNQIGKILNKPVLIRFGEGFKIESENEDLNQLTKELPLLQDVKVEALLAELFQHLFALGEVELVQGKVIEKEYDRRLIPSLPNKVKYTVTSIDDYNVLAKIEGTLEKQSFSLLGKVSVNEGEQELVNVTLTGTMNGEVKWNRDNAMLYDLQMSYTNAARFTLGPWEWMMNIMVTVHNRTRLKN